MALFPFQEQRQTGYIDERGRVVLRPKYSAGGPFIHGVASYSGHNEHIFIDTHGRELFRVPQMTHFEPFGPDGLAYFSRWDENGRQRAAFRELSGKERVLDYDDASTPFEGLAAARKNRGEETTWIGSAGVLDESSALWGYVNLQGEPVLDEEYERARSFCDGRAAISQKGRWGFIDAGGKPIVKPKYDGVSNFTDGLASVGTRDSKFKRPKKGPWQPDFEMAWGCIDRTGKSALPARWRTPLAFSEGMAPTCEKPFEYGFVDRGGTMASKARFFGLHALYRGTAPAQDKKSKKWGLVDREGAWSLAPKLESIGRFVEGVAAFTRRSSRTAGKSQYGYLNVRGETVFEYSV